MRFLEKIGLTGLIFGSSCIFPSSDFYKEFSEPSVYNLSEDGFFSEEDIIRNTKLKKFVDENLEKIMHKQEEFFSFKYPGIPQILIGMPDERNISSIGLYKMNEDKLYLNEFSFFDDLDNLDNLNEDLVNLVLSHELGHYYSDKLIENKISKNFYNRNFSKEEFLGLLIIQEGIAEYFRDYPGEDSFDSCFDDSLWPSDILELQLNRYIYAGGYFLVKPVLDKFGVEKGVEYLFKNPPQTEKELLDLPGYRRDVIKSLESKL